MMITEVHITLAGERDNRLRAFATIVLDNAFIIHDLKIIEGPNRHFVAMPSRKREEPCHACKRKNPLGSKYCSECGSPLRPSPSHNPNRRAKGLYIDVVHPLTEATRQEFEEKILEAYFREKGRGEEKNVNPVES